MYGSKEAMVADRTREGLAAHLLVLQLAISHKSIHRGGMYLGLHVFCQNENPVLAYAQVSVQ